MPENPSTIEHDIAELEHLLESKKAALEHEKSEKDLLHGILGEKIKQHAPQYVPLPPDPKTGQPSEELSQDLKSKVQSAVGTVWAKNLEEGIKEATKSGNAALIDAFHDTLVDELYEKLIQMKKIDKVE